MFWGLILEAGKRYSQEVVKSFHVSMASLEINPNTDDDGTVPVMLEYGDGREFLLCNLHKERNMQCKLDLNFKEGEHIGFYSASGKSRVHLTGYLEEELYDMSDEGEEEEEEDEEEEQKSILSEATKRKLLSKVSDVKKQKLSLPEESDGEEEEEEEEEDSDFEIKEDSEGEEEESEGNEDEDEEEEEEEDSDNLTTSVKKKGNEVEQKQDSSKKVKKPKKEAKELQQQKGNDSLQAKGAEKKTPNGKLKKKENENQSQKTPIHKQNGQVKTPQSKKSQEANETSKKKLNGGVTIEDKIVGNGAVAKTGSKVTVYYVGRLKQNNKQFDSTTSGAGFKFVLGRGEVIKGWDIGLLGMKVGGKRIITIPSNLAYGSRGQPPVIPSNSDLIFEVELRGVSK